MNDIDFSDAMQYLMKSKGRRLDNDMLVVWFTILIKEEKYTAKMINYAVHELARSNNQFPTCNDIINIINPTQDPHITASNHLDMITKGDNPPELAFDTFYTLFNTIPDYTNLDSDKKRWARREFLELYIKNMQEGDRLKQISEVNDTKQIGDRK